MQGKGHWVWRYQLEGDLIEVLIKPINANLLSCSIKDKEFQVRATLDQDKLRIEINKQSMHLRVYNSDLHLTLFSNQGQTTIERFNWSKLDLRTTTNKGNSPRPCLRQSLLY